MYVSPILLPPTFWETHFLSRILAEDGIKTQLMHHSPINQNFELNKSRQKFHHSLKEHHKISNIPKLRCKML